jgi:AraC-like DNA-binding protein
VLARLCRSVLGETWSPLTVCFSHEAPAGAGEVAVFQRVFNCRPQFNSEFNGIVVAAADLDRPNIKADDQLASHARQLLDAVMSPARRTTTQDVNQLIQLLLPSGRATIHDCAAAMGLTVRTLQRMLDTEQTSFSALLNSARMQLAVQYLSNRRMRITDVAEMLGYSSIGAFTRWHSSAFGIAPRKARARGLNEAVADRITDRLRPAS